MRQARLERIRADAGQAEAWSPHHTAGDSSCALYAVRRCPAHVLELIAEVERLRSRLSVAERVLRRLATVVSWGNPGTGQYLAREADSISSLLGG